jgi:uncharacterized protein (DUF1499 family)
MEHGKGMNNPHGTSRLISWSGKLALMGLLLAPLAVLSVRIGINFRVGLGIFALCSLVALVVIVAMAIAWFLPRYHNQRRSILKSALPALPLALLMLVIMGSSGAYPPIHDITTDTDDPPLFDAAVQVRLEGTNPLDIKPDSIAAQLEFYPDLASIETSLSQAEAMEKAAEVAAALEWYVYNIDPLIGVVEASYTSAWFGFIDDIVIRVRPAGPGSDSGSVIDLRSVSRVGVGDLGANAKRIRAFVVLFES